MTQSAVITVLLILTFVAANLPFINERFFVVGPSLGSKKFWLWQLLELAVFGALLLLVGFYFEGHLGQRFEQGWQFYVIFACLMLTFAFPGFVWRYLRKH